MSFRRTWSPNSIRLLQLAATMLVTIYMLLIGGSFAASVVFQLQQLNFLAAGSLGLVWLLVRLIQRRRLQPTGLELGLLVFAASQWLAVFTSVQPRLGLEWAASVIAWIAAFLIVSDLITHGWPRIYLLNAMAVVAAILAAHGLWSAAQWFIHWAALGMLPPVAFRYDGLLEEANITASAINLLWPILIVRALQARRPISRLGLGALAAGLLVTLFFTSSRAGWIAAAVALATMVILLTQTSSARRLWPPLLAAWQRQAILYRATALATVLVVTAGGVWLLLKEAQHISHGNLFESRQQFWSVAWRLFIGRPWTGVGPDLFGWFYSRFASIPPDFFAGHAHSLVMQILSGSGILGFAALLGLTVMTARRLWQQWLATGRLFEVAGLVAALVGISVHSLFDLPLGTFSLFNLLLVVTIVALALAPDPPPPSPGRVHPAWVAPLIVLPIGIFGFVLIIASGDAMALALAGAGQWRAAAQVFERTAQSDPGLTLYWEEAAYAYTRAGDLGAALPLWRRAAHDDPNWALLPANIGAVSHDLGAAQAARALAPGSQIFALSAGAVAEANGDPAAAQEAYQRALDIGPSSQAALYWQQTPLRQQVLAGWLSQQPADTSTLGQAETALAHNDLNRALALFEQARAQGPDNARAYLGLAQTYLNLRQYVASDRNIQAGLSLPPPAVEQTLAFHALAADLAEARGQRAAAAALYSSVFSAFDDYDVSGPASYGFPQRSRGVFHREGLPGEIVPQMARADITADLDARFAKLAQWDLAAGQTEIACHILERVHREAPVSVSGQLYLQKCQSPSAANPTPQR
jgi:Tfp pilus assembly protein PilF/O-antigen ligase